LESIADKYMTVLSSDSTTEEEKIKNGEASVLVDTAISVWNKLKKKE
jgi:hypothetical protein